MIERWRRLPHEYPMTAPAYSEHKSHMAKATDWGGKLGKAAREFLAAPASRKCARASSTIAEPEAILSPLSRPMIESIRNLSPAAISERRAPNSRYSSSTRKLVPSLVGQRR
jgi:hypothetical protein